MHYVIGDVHGCYDELMALLGRIEERDADAQIIFTGDLIDRGPRVMDVLAWAMEHITADGKYQTVRGNHEQLVIEWFSQFLLWDTQQADSGIQLPMPRTHYDFWRRLADTGQLTPKKTLPFIQFFYQMPFSKQLKIETAGGRTVAYRIVHAWYDPKEPDDSEKQHYTNIWERNYFGKKDMKEIIIHGHTPTIVREYYLRGMFLFGDAPGMVCYRPGAVNIDGGCCFSPHYSEFPCMLCGICLETFEEIYPYTLEERFARKAPFADDFSGYGTVQDPADTPGEGCGPSKGASMDGSGNTFEDTFKDTFMGTFRDTFIGTPAEASSIRLYAQNKADGYRKKYRKKLPLPRQKMLEQLGIQ